MLIEDTFGWQHASALTQHSYMSSLAHIRGILVTHPVDEKLDSEAARGREGFVREELRWESLGKLFKCERGSDAVAPFFGSAL